MLLSAFLNSASQFSIAHQPTTSIWILVLLLTLLRPRWSTQLRKVGRDLVHPLFRADVLQDSAFLDLPLELRHQVYNYFIHLRANKIMPTSNALEYVTNLTGISQQIRYEVYGFLAAVNTLHTNAGIFRYFTLRPLSTATKIKSMNSRASLCFETLLPEDHSAFREVFEGKIQRLKDEIKPKEVPSKAKFWKVCVSVVSAHRRVRLVANIDFREKEVIVCRPGTVSDDLHDLHDFQKTFVNAMQEFTKEENFDGLTVQDVSRFLEQVTMPDPKGFWKAEEMFEELKEAGDYE